MAMSGKDLTSTEELLRKDYELKTIFSSLEALRDVMVYNRAEENEVLLYQLFLLYKASLGGDVGMEMLEDPRKVALDVIEKLTKFTTREDSNSVKTGEWTFLHPKFAPERYIEAFYILIKDNYAILTGKTRYYGGFEKAHAEEYIQEAENYISFISPAINKDARVLDCEAKNLPPFLSLEDYQEYVILENDSLYRAYLVIRKEIEGYAWNRVKIINQLSMADGEFDCILPGILFNSFTNEYFAEHLTSQGVIISSSFPVVSGCSKLVESGMLDTVITLTDVGKFGRMIFICRKNHNVGDPILFADLGLSAATFKNLNKYNLNTLKEIGEEHFVSVSATELVPTNLNPGYYLTIRKSSSEKTAPLRTFLQNRKAKKYVIIKEAVEGIFEVQSDPRLLETKPDHSFDPNDDHLRLYMINEPSILITGRKSNVGYTCAKNGPVLIDGRIHSFTVDTRKADIRYITLQIRQRIMSVARYLNSMDELLELHIPNISLSEQNDFVNRYLNELKNEFNSKLDVKDTTLQLIVFSPNKDSFEVINKEKMDKLCFRVLEYVEDKSSFKEALSEHCGKDVLSSKLADAVLVCADMPAAVIEKALYFVHNLNTRVFYYSDSPSYDLGKMDEDLLEDFNKGFIQSTDYLEIIRKTIDADSSRVRERYPKFFEAADHLDKDYGWGLAEYATGLLQGKPFKMDINKLRSKIDETIITFFKSHHIAPAEMDNMAVASLVADKKYYEGRKKVNINLTEELSKTALDAEAWYKYALVAIRKLGNKDSHSSSDSDSSLELAAFTLFTEIIVWLDSVRERYKEKKCMFVIKKGNVELPFYPVEEYQVDGKDYLVANSVHLIDTKRELKAGDQVVILDTEAEKYPKTINGFRVEEVASPSNYIVAIKN